MILSYHQDNLHAICHELGEKDPQLRFILKEHGHPPLWIRPNSFETLVLTIIEQQVSLASAYATFRKLKAVLPVITPEALLTLSDEEMRACSLTRQKTLYTRILAQAILDQQIDLEYLSQQPDEEVRNTLKALKGIGDWTVDIYLLHALCRTDIFPTGDIALVNAMKALWPGKINSKDDLVAIAAPWRPYRSIATMILWHYYIQKKGIRIEG